MMKKIFRMLIIISVALTIWTCDDGSSEDDELNFWLNYLKNQPANTNVCANNESECQPYSNSCATGSNGACYCAAACTCALCGETVCQQENSQNATSMGYSCPY